jgi:hypothetical protein
MLVRDDVDGETPTILPVLVEVLAAEALSEYATPCNVGECPFLASDDSRLEIDACSTTVAVVGRTGSDGAGSGAVATPGANLQSPYWRPFSSLRVYRPPHGGALWPSLRCIHG